jgi:3-phenylpropionate/cinnamic acid dioxygenase small subunit
MRTVETTRPTSHEEIRQLYMAYAHGLDNRDFEQARATFAPGCQVTGAYVAGPVDDYFPKIRARVELYARTAHFISNIYVEDLDGERAATQAYCTAYHLDPFDGSKPWVIAVRYSDVVTRLEDGWKVTERHVDEFWQRDSI